MKIIKKTLLAASIIGATLATVSLSTATADEKAVTKIAADVAADVAIATVNGKAVMKSTLDNYLKVLKRSGKADKEAALSDLIATEIALQEAYKTDILTRPASKKAIEDFTRNVLLKTWTKEKVDSFNITDEEIKAAYDERVTKLASKEYNARHILVKTEDEAKAIIKELDGGADFEKLAKEKSTGPSGSNGGSLGWFKAKTMVPAFADAVKTMSKGEVSKAPVKTQFGYHIIKVEDSRDAKLPTLDSLKGQLTRAISQKKMLAHMLELKKTTDIKILAPANDEVAKDKAEKAEKESKEEVKKAAE